MKLFRFIAAAFVIAASLSLSASAQTPARPQPSAPAGGGTAATGTGRIAVIDSAAFSDDKAGIARVVNAMKTVDTQFQPLRTEVQGMQSRYEALVADINKTRDVADPKTIAAKVDQADTMKRDIERKTQDAQISIQKRMQEVLGPLQEDVFNALQGYAQSRGIAIVIDMNRVPVLFVADSVDITRDFITEYNRTHPATTAAAGTGRP